MPSIHERLYPAVMAAYSSLLRGDYAGLCAIVRDAPDSGVITRTEYAALRSAIDRSTDDGFYVVDSLIAEHPDAYPAPGMYVDGYSIHQQPAHVVQQCADKWKVWALGIIDAVDGELGYAK